MNMKLLRCRGSNAEGNNQRQAWTAKKHMYLFNRINHRLSSQTISNVERNRTWNFSCKIATSIAISITNFSLRVLAGAIFFICSAQP